MHDQSTSCSETGRIFRGYIVLIIIILSLEETNRVERNVVLLQCLHWYNIIYTVVRAQFVCRYRRSSANCVYVG
jgi:hypothetical protein